jgi:transcriptional regulator with XRE-family HTH domain
VTPDERKAALKTGRIIRTSRKSRGWTQVETSQKIGISQSALSKLEAGQLIPSVHQWFEFCSYAGIPVDSHILGYLDRMEPVSLHERIPQQDFKMKKIYTDYAGSTARSLFPILRWAEQKIAPEKIKTLWKEMGVDPDYFVDLSNPINFRFYADLVGILKEKGFLKKTDLAKLTQPVSDLKNHGLLSQTYFQSSDMEGLIKSAFARSSFYEVNFEYQIEDINRKKIIFSATPKSHLREYKQLHFLECQDFLPEYRGSYFKSLLNAVPHKSALHSKEHTVSYKGGERCVHEITLS